jgi:NAD-dependent deacetylase
MLEAEPMTSEADLNPLIAELQRLVRGAKRGVALTGAGISTESGIPDFRSPGGLWSQNMPIHYGDFISSAEMRAEAWRRKFVLDDATKGVTPNSAHYALARLVEEGHLSAVVTQNIDGLHLAAGTPEDRLIEIHGNGTYAKCLDCDCRYGLDWVRERYEATKQSPLCEACGGYVKSGTVSFGQAMPAEKLRRAEALAADADVFLALGSSLVVFPAAALPLIAKRSGAILIVVNREPTDMDAVADLVIHASLGVVFETFQQR